MLPMKQIRIVQADKGSTRHRRTDYIVISLEQFLKMLRMGHCHRLKASIGLRLTATGLIERIVHIQTEGGKKFI